MKNRSLKQAFQGMIPESIGITVGDVIAVNPVKIQVVNNTKMVLSGSNLIIPKHLTDYTVSMDVNFTTDEAQIHTHSITGEKTFLVHGSLKTGDKVIMLRIDGGSIYVVLDRKVD